MLINQDDTYLDVMLDNPIRAVTNFIASAYGRNTYSAKVIVCFKCNDMVLYDVVDILLASFVIKKDSAKANSQRDTFEAAESMSETSVSTDIIRNNSAKVNPRKAKKEKSDSDNRYALPKVNSGGQNLFAEQREFFKDIRFARMSLFLRSFCCPKQRYLAAARPLGKLTFVKGVVTLLDRVRTRQIYRTKSRGLAP